jgi:hypothetical protein
MKPQFLLSLFSLLAVAHTFAADPQVLLSEGQQALLRGDTTTAKTKFTQVNRMDPKNPVAIGFLKQIAVQEANAPGSPQTERELTALIVPQVQFKEASLSSALDFLKKKASDLTGGKKAVNIVLAPGVDPETKITLNLANIPMTEVLKYIGEMAGAKVEYQKFAVMLRPAGGGVAKPAEKSPEQ